MFIGKTVGELRHTIHGNFLVVVVLRGNDNIIPTGDTRILENDKLYLLATEKDFESIFDQIGRKRLKLDRVVILGGTRMGQMVVEYLIGEEAVPRRLLDRVFRKLTTATGRNITIIDSDYEVCRALSDKFTNVLVLNADISDEHFEEDEHIARPQQGNCLRPDSTVQTIGW